ncbi:MAG: transketolase [Candidatus Woesearchaeota archaeon]
MNPLHTLKNTHIAEWANLLRKESILMTTEAGSGHPSSCLSSADIVAELFCRQLIYDPKNSHNEENDEFILSKGHAAPVLYAALYHTGALKADLKTLRKPGTILEGHPMPHTIPWVKVATGSLGQGASVGVGMALSQKRKNSSACTYVLCGDGEFAEGSVIEALDSASHYKLDNLCILIDVNRLGQTGETMHGHQMHIFEERARAYGCSVHVIDGHNIAEINEACIQFRKSKNGKPTVIIAKTLKGKGVSCMEDHDGWHGKPISREQVSDALEELSISGNVYSYYKPRKPAKSSRLRKPTYTIDIPITYHANDKIATRKAYGKALAKLAKKNKSIIAVDAETKNSTHAEDIESIRGDALIQAYIAEQNMAGIALGLSVKGYRVCASTFGAFLTRCHDQIRMAALSSATITFVGSHAGVSIGEDGASQMALEDLAMFRSLLNSTVVYPADGVATEKLLAELMAVTGISYMRTGRPAVPIIYKNSDTFPIGKCKIVHQSSKDSAVIIGAGMTLIEAIAAYHILKEKGIFVTVIDMYSLKPFTAEKMLAEAVRKAKSNIIVSEDHYPEGGIGDVVRGALQGKPYTMKHLAVQKMPCSASGSYQMNVQGIDRHAIVSAVMKLIKKIA